MCYRRAPRPDKPDKYNKAPTDPDTGRRISKTDPANWRAFEEAAAAAAANPERVDGVGIVLTDSDPLACLDIDDCFEDGAPASWAMELVRRFDSYTER